MNQCVVAVEGRGLFGQVRPDVVEENVYPGLFGFYGVGELFDLDQLVVVALVEHNIFLFEFIVFSRTLQNFVL